jgi:hypothetical protein
VLNVHDQQLSSTLNQSELGHWQAVAAKDAFHGFCVRSAAAASGLGDLHSLSRTLTLSKLQKSSCRALQPNCTCACVTRQSIVQTLHFQRTMLKALMIKLQLVQSAFDPQSATMALTCQSLLAPASPSHQRHPHQPMVTTVCH